ncbi:hypothetical protein TanjilG_23421 [Lupinus angustifolius]|uniref:C2 domain-containing protein n=1 Tax=Lupinus angustifolius TaxID=3871 RepID=A0A4P1R9S2_LUPAN|nr:PREDICTED: synaptotagmin-2-like isoform X1 [Lupinus angustifolius]XP_019451184.1 PREDICTED: synaptotagmin-2-like isoform X1 [Lupinus angustifolius]OIW05635.1 hypothetical protein TanjilG_23421 [Lupinus angustifolius]
MILQPASATFTFSHFFHSLCPCNNQVSNFVAFPFSRRRRKRFIAHSGYRKFRRKISLRLCAIPLDNCSNRNWNTEFANSTTRGAKSFVFEHISNEIEEENDHGVSHSQESQQVHLGSSSNFTKFEEDPIVDKLRTQLGVIHPIPSPPINKNVVGLFVFFFFVGVVFDKLWTSRRRNKVSSEDSLRGVWPQVPTSFSLFLEKDLQRKESVEWVNMVLGKLWKGYRGGIENWIIGLLQPVIDDLKKPDYVQRVEIKQFSLGDEPLSVRNVERRTSRRVNDLQYQIGLRYTGGARMLLMLSLKFGIIPIVVPVGVRDFDIDGELWVKLRLIPTKPWVGAASWAFVSLPKIKFELSPFRLFNLMAIPVLSMFLTKLLTEDLPRLFVRPKKIVLDFQKGKSVGPVANDVKSGEMQDGNKDSVGELSVTLVDARKLSYFFYGKTDPYVILSLGNQSIRSKKNTQTTVIGSPGMPIWNQDFHMLVANPRKQKLLVQVKDYLGFAYLTIGTGEVDLGSLKDTVPTDRIVVLQSGWGILGKGSSGEILLRLTYKAYVEDEEDDKTVVDATDVEASDDDLSDSEEANVIDENNEEDPMYRTDNEPFMDVLAALIVSEEFQGIVASETGSTKILDNSSNAGSKISKSKVANAESIPSTSDNSEGFVGSALFWFAVITSISLLIALNIGGSNLLNP